MMYQDFHAPGRNHRWSIRCSIGSLALAYVSSVVALLLIVLADVESVLVTGPLIFLLGLLAIGASAWCRFAWGVVLGLAFACICVLFVVLVNVLRWSPADAKAPFAVMGLLFVALCVPLLARTWRTRPRGFQPWQCQQCGYPLHGLAGTQCPECGLEFDPARVVR